MEKINLARAELRKAEIEWQGWRSKKPPVNMAEAVGYWMKRDLAFERRQKAMARLHELVIERLEEAYL